MEGCAAIIHGARLLGRDAKGDSVATRHPGPWALSLSSGRWARLRIFFSGGSQLAELEAGLVAAVLSVSFAIFSGGVAAVLLTLWKFSTYAMLWAYQNEGHFR